MTPVLLLSSLIALLWVIIGELVWSDATATNLCSKNNVRYVDGFLLEQLRAARAQLGLPANGDQDFNMHEMVNVFSHSMKLKCLSISNSTQCYVPIEKCAHSGIVKNLMQMTEQFASRVSRMSDIEDGHQPSELLPQLVQKHQHVPIFTFIRDPLGHFLSGIAEAIMWQYYRKEKLRRHHPDLAVHRTSEITKEHAEIILNNYVTFNRHINPLVAIEHTYPMSGVLFTHNLDFVGSLDSFDTDWETWVVPQ